MLKWRVMRLERMKARRGPRACQYADFNRLAHFRSRASDPRRRRGRGCNFRRPPGRRNRPETGGGRLEGHARRPGGGGFFPRPGGHRSGPGRAWGAGRPGSAAGQHARRAGSSPASVWRAVVAAAAGRSQLAEVRGQ